MKISIVAFDDFTDIDVFLMWDLLNRVKHTPQLRVFWKPLESWWLRDRLFKTEMWPLPLDVWPRST